MYSWAHSEPVITQSEVVPGKLPSLDWLLKADSSSDEKSESVHQKGVTYFTTTYSFNFVN